MGLGRGTAEDFARSLKDNAPRLPERPGSDAAGGVMGMLSGGLGVLFGGKG